mgnify:CR=1 FL=1|jgi:hypothetical protein
MRVKHQTTYDLNSEQFRYLKKDIRNVRRVDINHLNKRLNETKRSNFYATFLVTVICFSSLAILSLISIKF